MSTPSSPSGPPASVDTGALGCCGGPAAAGTPACCALDEAHRATGQAGCGCSEAAPADATSKADGSGPCCGAPAPKPGALSHR
jgi:hypothetical protein